VPSRLIGPLNRFGNQLTNVFLNSLSDQKSIDAAKQLRYAEHYNEYSHKKLGRMSENCSNGYNMNKHIKKLTYNDLIIAYASRYKARLNYLYMIYR
jgi:hypothetical protein